MATISTFAEGTRFVTSALVGLGATSTDPNGRFYLDGNMVNVELSQVIADAIYIDEIFRDGQSVNGKYVTGQKQGGAVRVMLDTPMPFGSRTTSFGGREGTTGNSGVLNKDPSLLPTNDEFMVYLNQINDQRMDFPDLGKEYVPLDVMAKKISGYAKRVSMDRSSSILAEILAYNIFRALNDGDNINTVADLTADNAYNTLLNALNTKLDNGDPIRSAFTFPTEGRTIIAKPRFANGLFSSKSGVILNGSNLAQEMLRSYDLSASLNDKGFVGTGYKGQAMQFHVQSAPDYIWTLAEAYLGLPKGSFDNIYAVAVSFDATAVATNIDLGVKLVDGFNFRGVQMQPLNIWGHEAFRKSQIIGDTTLTTGSLTTLGFTADKRVYPVAPQQANIQNFDEVQVPIYDATGQIIGFRTVAQGAQPNGGNFRPIPNQVVAPTVTPAAGAVASGTAITLATTTTGATIYYTMDGTDPTINSKKYVTSAKPTITAATTLKAIAVKQGMITSPILTAAYTLS